MKIISRRLAKLESRVATGDQIPVMVVKETEDGHYTFRGEIFTASELEAFAEKHHTERIIIDNYYWDEYLDNCTFDHKLGRYVENAEATTENKNQ